MANTKVVNLRNSQHDIYIGRGSIWGNPFKISAVSPREDVIRQYASYLANKKTLLDQIHTLKGKRLGCYCKPFACHGDMLAHLADNWDGDMNTLRDRLKEIVK